MALSLTFAFPAAVMAEDTTAAEGTAEDADVKSEGVMTHDEYLAAAVDDEVTIETYVQAKQSWWEDKATFYTQDKDGAYFIYNMPCSEEDYEKLVPGTKINIRQNGLARLRLQMFPLSRLRTANTSQSRLM